MRLKFSVRILLLNNVNLVNYDTEYEKLRRSILTIINDLSQIEDANI